MPDFILKQADFTRSTAGISSEVKIPSLGEIKENAVAVMQSRTEVEEEADVRVSCVVTHYNRGHFLLQAVSSLLGQTHTNLEIIIWYA